MYKSFFFFSAIEIVCYWDHKENKDVNYQQMPLLHNPQELT